MFFKISVLKHHFLWVPPVAASAIRNISVYKSLLHLLIVNHKSLLLSYYHLSIIREASSRLLWLKIWKAYNNSFQQRLESLRYKTSLAITGAINGSPTKKLYQELELKPLQNRQWFWKLCVFYKIFTSPKIFNSFKKL